MTIARSIVTEERKYTLEEIKAAYWKQFHQSGEVWFPYGSGDSDEVVTDSEWDEFKEHLKK